MRCSCSAMRTRTSRTSDTTASSILRRASDCCTASASPGCQSVGSENLPSRTRPWIIWESIANLLFFNDSSSTNPSRTRGYRCTAATTSCGSPSEATMAAMAWPSCTAVAIPGRAGSAATNSRAAATISACSVPLSWFSGFVTAIWQNFTVCLSRQ